MESSIEWYHLNELVLFSIKIFLLSREAIFYKQVCSYIDITEEIKYKIITLGVQNQTTKRN